MFPTAPNLRLFLFAFCLLIFDFCCAYPSPYSHASTVFPRQETTLTLPVTVTQTERITTGVGTFIQTCTITLTPTVVDSMDMVREEKTCVVTPDNGNGDVSSALSPPASTSTIFISPSSLTGTNDTPSSTSNGASSSIVPPISTVQPGAVSGTLTFVPRPSVSSSVSLPPSSTGISSVPDPVVTPQPGGTGQPTSSLADNLGTTSTTLLSSSSLPLALSSGSLASSPSPTATPENAGAASLPGKKLQVLPIGLGVFAGVSAIALLVVGIVTYERAKHRRNFRKLKLEEANNQMGYGAA